MGLFGCDDGKTRYLLEIGALRGACGVQVYAYCLMSTHVHLIIDTTDARRMIRFLRGLADIHGSVRPRTFTGYDQSSTKLVPISSLAHGLVCMRYIERNPVVAGMVERAEDGWTSYRIRAVGAQCDWLDDPPWYIGLSSTSDERRILYEEFIAAPEKLMDDVLASLCESR